MARRRKSRRRRTGADVPSSSAKRRARRRRGVSRGPSAAEYDAFAKKHGFETASRQAGVSRHTRANPDFIAYLQRDVHRLSASVLRTQRDDIRRRLRSGALAGAAKAQHEEALEIIRGAISAKRGGSSTRRKGTTADPRGKIPGDPTGEEMRRIMRKVKALPQSKRKAFDAARRAGMTPGQALSAANKPAKRVIQQAMHGPEEGRVSGAARGRRKGREIQAEFFGLEGETAAQKRASKAQLARLRRRRATVGRRKKRRRK